MSTFKYQPLEQSDKIRLLVLQPGSGTSPIECSLLHKTLGTQPYEALSYEWKDASDCDPMIVVDGCDVRVRKNLRDALLQIRLVEENRYLWIDALCINQADVCERNKQVQKMGKIYKGARSVISWLGLASNNSDLAMEKLESVGEFMEGHDAKLFSLVDSFQNIQCQAILALCQRSYWQRAWILQEVFLARKLVVHCGDKSSSIVALDNSLCCLGRVREYDKGIVSSAAFEHVLARRAPPQMNVLSRWVNVSLSQNYVATEPRDIIYAMLGIASDCQDGELLPDYEKPLVEVYFDALAIMRCGKNNFSYKLAERLELLHNKRVSDYLGLNGISEYD